MAVAHMLQQYMHGGRAAQQHCCHGLPGAHLLLVKPRHPYMLLAVSLIACCLMLSCCRCTASVAEAIALLTCKGRSSSQGALRLLLLPGYRPACWQHGEQPQRRPEACATGSCLSALPHLHCHICIATSGISVFCFTGSPTEPWTDSSCWITAAGSTSTKCGQHVPT
jgi:hypothetical protein